MAAVSPSIRLDLLMSLLREAKDEEEAGRGGPAIEMLQDLVAARKTVIGPRLAYLGETIRTEDLGVTVRSLSEARLPVGKSWWEWSPAIPGRLPPETIQSKIDMVGVLVDVDETGQRGVMQMAIRMPNLVLNGKVAVMVMPICLTFDIREDAEPVDSLLASPDPQDVRQRLDQVRDPTVAEMEACSVTSAILSRRFGVVRSRYYKLSQPMDQETTLVMAQEAAIEGVLLVCLHVCLLSVPVRADIVPGEHRAKHLPRKKSASVFTYTILEAA